MILRFQRLQKIKFNAPAGGGIEMHEDPNFTGILSDAITNLTQRRYG